MVIKKLKNYYLIYYMYVLRNCFKFSGFFIWVFFVLFIIFFFMLFSIFFHITFILELVIFWLYLNSCKIYLFKVAVFYCYIFLSIKIIQVKKMFQSKNNISWDTRTDLCIVYVIFREATTQTALKITFS